MKKVLVTGSNKGIGLAATTVFLKHGYHAVIVARDFSTFPLQDTYMQHLQFDLRHYNAIPHLAREIGDIDILMNNTGMMQALPYDHYPEDRVDDMVAVNLRTPVWP